MAFLRQSRSVTSRLTPEEIVGRLRPITREGYHHTDLRGGEIEECLDDSGRSDLYQGYLSTGQLRLRRRGSPVALRATLTREADSTIIALSATLNHYSLGVLLLFTVLPWIISIQFFLAGLMQASGKVVFGCALWSGLVLAASHWNVEMSATRFQRHMEHLLQEGPVGGA
jgi:hypothetical protein